MSCDAHCASPRTFICASKQSSYFVNFLSTFHFSHETGRWSFMHIGKVPSGPSIGIARNHAVSRIADCARGVVISMAAATAAATSARRCAERRTEAISIHRFGRCRCAIAVGARREGRHLATQLMTVAMRAFGVARMARAHERLERYFAVVASIFVNRHLADYSSIGCAYSTSTPRVALG